VRTVDAGHHWTVVARLPAAIRVNFGFQATRLSFASPRVGYLGGAGSSVWMTTDGGGSWSRVATPGVDPTFLVGTSRLWVTSSLCPRTRPHANPQTCRSVLTSYRWGSPSASSSNKVPVPRTGVWRGATPLAQTPDSVAGLVVNVGATEGGRSSLFSTTDDGASWRRVANPCGADPVSQLLTQVPTRWLLYCWQDQGMNQGHNELWSSSTRGASWTPIANESMGHSDASHVGDEYLTVTYSGNRRLLWAAVGGASGGLEYSVDGGSHWASVDVATDLYGGSPEFVSALGATGAIFGVVTGPQWETTNGRTWARLPGLAAGEVNGHPLCSPSVGARAHVGFVGTTPTNTTHPGHSVDVEVVNDGSARCYLTGTPTLRLEAGSPLARRGQPGVPACCAVNPVVVLEPHRGVASVFVNFSPVASYGAGYCRPFVVRALRLTFAPGASFRVASPPLNSCAAFSTASVGVAQRGVAHSLLP
ncbi:MAG: DUF4232 domain-containing protein, partial [Acidimicrobiales bacterium]